MTKKAGGGTRRQEEIDQRIVKLREKARERMTGLRRRQFVAAVLREPRDSLEGGKAFGGDVKIGEDCRDGLSVPSVLRRRFLRRLGMDCIDHVTHQLGGGAPRFLRV